MTRSITFGILKPTDKNNRACRKVFARNNKIILKRKGTCRLHRKSAEEYIHVGRQRPFLRIAAE
jgi:hypothetical protein